MSEPTIRWNPAAELFFVDFGHVRFGVARQQALDLSRALSDAVAIQDLRGGK